MKKWIKPIIRELSIKETKCGSWRYAIKCSSYPICNNYFYSYSSYENEKCPYCNSPLIIDTKWWSPDYCDGTCKS